MRALEYYRDDVGPDDAQVMRYRRAVQIAASRCGPVALNVTGLTLALGTVMAAAKPVNEEADRFMEALREELGQDAWFEADFRRDIWYLNLLHFAKDIACPDRLVEWVKQRRDLHFGVTRRTGASRTIPIRQRQWSAIHAAGDPRRSRTSRSRGQDSDVGASIHRAARTIVGRPRSTSITGTTRMSELRKSAMTVSLESDGQRHAAAPHCRLWSSW